MSKPRSHPPRHAKAEPSGRERAAPREGGLHLVAVDFSWFSLPFPTRVERFLFRHPWAVILAASLVNQSIRLVADSLFSLVTLVLAASAALFGGWMRDIPNLLQHLSLHCIEGSRERFDGLVREARLRRESRRRFLPVVIALLVALLFMGVFIPWRQTSLRYILALGPGLLVWAWMIGAAGSVAFDVAWFVRTLGGANILRVLPEHPDGCGGLRPLGLFFARMVSPLLLVAVLLGLASAAPEMTPAQAKYFWSRSLVRPFQPPDVSWYEPTRSHFLTTVGAARLKRLEKECAELTASAESPAYQDCISRLVAESKVVEKARNSHRYLLWRGSVTPFARAGLFILSLCIALCFLWPLRSVHLAMARERDARGLALANDLEAAEAQFGEKLKARALGAAAELSEQLEKVRQQVLRVRGYPVWPFDAAAVSRVAVPQLLALGSTLAGIISDWLAKS